MRVWALLLLVPLTGCLADSGSWPEPVPIVDPELPPEMRPLLDASAPVLDAMPWAPLADGSNPISFGMTFRDMGNRSIREFELAALQADAEDGGHDHPFHKYGHPSYNHAVARVPVTFAGHEGVELYGEIMLPERGDAPAEGRYPLIVALEGLQGNLAMYRWWHQVFADAGYIVFAFDFTGQGHSGGSDQDTDRVRIDDARRALDYILDESPVARFIDERRVGVIAHSMGAFTALDWQAQDDRIHAIVAGAPIHESRVSFTSSDIPIMVQTGDHDGPIAPIPFANPAVARGVYDMLEADRAFIVTEAASHCQHSNYPLCPQPTWGYAIAGDMSLDWMEWHLRGDEDARDRLLVAPLHLSTLWGSEVRLEGETTVLAAGSLG